MKKLASLLLICVGLAGQAQTVPSTSFSFRNPNPNNSILFAPSAFQQPARTGYYNNFLGLVNHLEFGFTDWISLHVAAVATPIAIPFNVSVKSTHQILPWLRAGGMLSYTSSFTEKSFLTLTGHSGYAVTPSALVGVGTEDYNINLSTGYNIGTGTIRGYGKFGSFDSDWVTNQYTYANTWNFTANGQARATDYVAVVAELDVLMSQTTLLAGVRINNSTRKQAWDLGVFKSNLLNYPLPYVAWTANF